MGVLGPYKQEFMKLVQNSLSKNTWQVYENAIANFEQFRVNHHLDLNWPVPISDLINFIAYLSVQSYSPNTVKSYLAGLGFKMKMENTIDSTESFIIKKMISGMSKTYKSIDIRKPISENILADLINVLPKVCFSQYEAKLFSAIFALAFFAFLRIGEAVSSGLGDHIIQRNDLEIDQTTKNISITIASSKTDQYGHKTKLVINSGSSNVELFEIINQYLKVRPLILGPLFCHLNHKVVSRFQVCKVLKTSLQFLGLNDSEYNTHSFRIGACTHAFQMGKSEDEIMLMGRWKSDVYKKYIRINHSF